MQYPGLWYRIWLEVYLYTIVSIVVPFFGLTNIFLLRNPEGSPQKEQRRL